MFYAALGCSILCLMGIPNSIEEGDITKLFCEIIVLIISWGILSGYSEEEVNVVSGMNALRNWFNRK